MEDKYIWEKEEAKIEEEKRKKILAGTKEAKKKREELKEKRKKKRKRRNIILLIVSFIILVSVIPLFKIEKVIVKENVYFENSKIIDDIGFKNSFSIVEYLYKKYITVHKIDYLEEIKVKYDNNSKNMIIYAQEFKPLYHDIKANTYYSNSQGSVKKININYATPLIDGIPRKKTKQIAEQLKNVDPDILLKIKKIEMADEKKYGADVLKFLMYDGNTVYIYEYQIEQKMNYYNQIKQILNENDKGKGNLYLYIGDYYEPYE